MKYNQCALMIAKILLLCQCMIFTKYTIQILPVINPMCDISPSPPMELLVWWSYYAKWQITSTTTISRTKKNVEPLYLFLLNRFPGGRGEGHRIREKGTQEGYNLKKISPETSLLPVNVFLSRCYLTLLQLQRSNEDSYTNCLELMDEMQDTTK